VDYEHRLAGRGIVWNCADDLGLFPLWTAQNLGGGQESK
jgi:hypothetical protein